jgi:hypothetical protein
MADLPIEPAECPGTEEYEEIYKQRKRRQELALWHQYEDDLERRYLRHA